MTLSKRWSAAGFLLLVGVLIKPLAILFAATIGVFLVAQRTSRSQKRPCRHRAFLSLVGSHRCDRVKYPRSSPLQTLVSLDLHRQIPLVDAGPNGVVRFRRPRGGGTPETARCFGAPNATRYLSHSKFAAFCDFEPFRYIWNSSSCPLLRDLGSHRHSWSVYTAMDSSSASRCRSRNDPFSCVRCELSRNLISGTGHKSLRLRRTVVGRGRSLDSPSSGRSAVGRQGRDSCCITTTSATTGSPTHSWDTPTSHLTMEHRCFWTKNLDGCQSKHYRPDLQCWSNTQCLAETFYRDGGRRRSNREKSHARSLSGRVSSRLGWLR